MREKLTSCRYRPQPCSHYLLWLFCREEEEEEVRRWENERKEKEGSEKKWHTGEDGWSRRQSKSSQSWDRGFWGPHEGPSSLQLLCSYLMLPSPPSRSLFPHFLSLFYSIFLLFHLLFFTPYYTHQAKPSQDQFFTKLNLFYFKVSFFFTQEACEGRVVREWVSVSVVWRVWCGGDSFYPLSLSLAEAQQRWKEPGSGEGRRPNSHFYPFVSSKQIAPHPHRKYVALHCYLSSPSFGLSSLLLYYIFSSIIPSLSPLCYYNFTFLLPTPFMHPNLHILWLVL